MKRTIKKLNLRRETLSNLDLQQAGGGDFQVNTARSICNVCVVGPVTTTRFTTTTTPQTGVITGTSVINPVGGF
jgi:hypothetical protein